MPRAPFITSTEFPYHIYNRTEDRNIYDLPSDTLWRLYTENLSILSWMFHIKIHAFVLMGNHYHLIASAPSQNLPEAIRYLQSQVSRHVRKICQTQRFRFGQRYKWKLVLGHKHYLDLLRYVYQNPVRAKIVDRCESYQWSSLHGLYGKTRLDFPVSPSFFPDHSNPENPNEFLEWVNNHLDDETLKKVRGMFRKVRGESKKETGTLLAEEGLG